MTHLRTFTAAAFAVLLMGAVPSYASAPATPAGASAPAGSIVFGIMDLDGVLRKSAAGEDILKTVNAKRKEFEAQISKEEVALKKQKDDIIQKRDKMTEADFEKQRKDFEKKAAEGFKLVQERKQMLDYAFNQSMTKLREEALKITAEIARGRNLDVVFSDNSVILAERGYDISEEVLARLNKDVKKIPVNFALPKKK